MSATYSDLAGKVAVATGGSRGIVAATAVALGAQRASVAVVGRDQVAIDSVVQAITAAGARAIGVAADCTVQSDLDALRDVVSDRLGPVGIVAAFAGGDGMPVPTASETADHWRRVIDSDLTSTFLMVSALLPDMVAEHRGAIVTMASAAAGQPARSSAAYAAAKAGVVAFSRHFVTTRSPETESG